MRTLALTAICCAAAAAPARAQQNFVPRDVTRGVTIPDAQIAGDFDATAVTLNPAGLGTLRGPNVAFVSTVLSEDETVVGPGGAALYLGLPLSFSLLGEESFTLGYGFGFQALDTPETWVGGEPGTASQDGSYLLNSVGIGTRELSVGWTVGNYFWADTPQNESITTHHVGLSLRPSRFLAAGLTMRDVFEPVGRVEGEKLERSYDVEIAARPLGDWRLEIAAGALAGEDELYDFRGRAAWRPLAGVKIFGTFESVERRFGGPAAGTSRDERVLAGIELDGLDAFIGRRRHGLGASYGLLTSSASARTYAASSVKVRWSGEQYPAIVEPKRIDQVELDLGGSDRDFVRTLLKLRRLENTRGAAGVLLVLRGGGASFAQAEELRDMIGRLRDAGRRVIAYLYEADMAAYYAASAGDRVLLHPAAEVALQGAAAQSVYLAELLADLGVEAQAVRIGEYKTAPEILTRRSASKEARRQIRAYLDDVVAHFCRRTGESRGLSPARVRALLERPSITPPEARELGLVDGVVHYDGLESEVERVFGEEIEIAREARPRRRPKQWAYPRVVVVHVEGDIVPGDSGGVFLRAARGEVIATAIREARESSRVEAIIVRVDSPGGAVLPSERIAREIALTADEKPIVVSMGGVAASGGYMVAAPADRIFAAPSTLTGSIGVFALKLSVRDLLERLGIYPEIVKVGEHADEGSLFRPWTRAELRARAREIRYIYRRFVELVAAGRGLSRDEVREAGGGRIYSASRAREVGLVDDLGGFSAALEAARQRAGISGGTEIEVVQRPVVSRDLLSKLLFGPAERAAAAAARRALPPAFREALRRVPPSLFLGGGALARLPWLRTELDDLVSPGL